MNTRIGLSSIFAVVLAVTFAYQANARSDQDVNDRDKLDRVEKIDRESRASEVREPDRERFSRDDKFDDRAEPRGSEDIKSDRGEVKGAEPREIRQSGDVKELSDAKESAVSDASADEDRTRASSGSDHDDKAAEKAEAFAAQKSGSDDAKDADGSSSSGSGSSGSDDLDKMDELDADDADKEDNLGSGSSSSGSGSSGSGGENDAEDSVKDDSDSSGSGKSGSGSSGSGSSSSGSGSSGSGDDDDAEDSDKDDSDSSGSGKSGSGSSGSDDSEDGQTTANAAAGLPGAVIERDASGREQRADEVILVWRGDAVDALKSKGFDVLGANRLSTSSEVIARVRVKSGDSVQQTLERLRAAAPGAVVAPNHIFRPSAGEVRKGIPASVRQVRGGKGRLGIVDTGVDVAGLRLNRSVLATRSFTGDAYTPREHGSAVAMIAANSGVAIDAADVFAADAQGALFTTAEAAAAAIDWLVDRGAPVINISIQGPDNPVLEKIVRSAIARGVVIVAAAGNSGPAAPPSYPAAYVGVIGVTAVDEQGKVYRRANRGDYISFAALGVHVPVAGPQSVSGTSYAAPSVAAVVARRHQAQSPEAAARVLFQLRAEAIDLGPPGRDKTYGWGWLR